ncbi:epsin-1 [Monosporozyma unispora]|nr:Epsin-1, required for endocytosis and actin patch assembly [Kazachstania unispora]
MLRSAKNIVKGYSSTEVTVRDATANNSTMPDRDMLEELADKSYNSSDFFEIMDMLDKRINDKGKYWRHVLKSLIVLDYLVRFGSENCVLWCKENLYIIKTLREFMHEDETGVDEGQIIRNKAKDLTSLLLDEERLKQERSLNKKNRGRRNNRSRGTSREDEDMRRAIEESRITAEEEEERRRRNAQDNDEDRRMALQLSQEEQELKRLQELQRQQELQAQQQAQQPQMYYDVFGNPITPEEYLQYQQQQALLAQQQQQALAQQQQQQYWAMQQQQQQAALLAQQQAQDQQQQLYGIQQAGMATGSNNPFARSNQQSASASTTQTTTPSVTAPSTANTTTTTQQPLKQTRTGNQSISDKYSALNTLLATGATIDTFGNTGEQRIPAQHTQTGTFINSQGTGYRQVTDKDNANPFFMGTQYTGLPSSNIVPSQTGYGFGNSSTNNNQNNNTLLDL